MDLDPPDVIAAIGVVVALFSAILGAISGGFIAGYFSLKATKILISDQRKLLEEEHEKRSKEAEEERQAKVRALKCALFHEINGVWTVYSDGVGKIMDSYIPNREGFVLTFPIIGNYFPVFDSSVSNIGIIPDPALRHKIIEAYSLGKSLMDSFKYNNDLVLRREKAQEDVFLNNTNATNTVLKIKTQNLAAYAGPLKELHKTCKASVESLIAALENDAKTI